MTQGKKFLTVLGATGSIGVSTLDVVARHPDRYGVFALTAHRQVDKLFEQCRVHLWRADPSDRPDARGISHGPRAGRRRPAPSARRSRMAASGLSPRSPARAGPARCTVAGARAAPGAPREAALVGHVTCLMTFMVHPASTPLGPDTR